MNRTWNIIAIVIAVILLAIAIIKFWGLYAIFSQVHGAFQNNPEFNTPRRWMLIVLRHHSVILQILLSLTGFILLLLKKKLGWTITVAIFGSLLFTILKNLLWFREDYQDDADISLVTTILISTLICFACFALLLTIQIRRNYAIGGKQLLHAVVLFALIVLDGHLFSIL